jgi:hypothetical protein
MGSDLCGVEWYVPRCELKSPITYTAEDDSRRLAMCDSLAFHIALGERPYDVMKESLSA